MSTLTLNVNGINYTVTVNDPSMPLLWVLRDHIGLTGTKYGCGIEVCGACTVLVNDQPERSCDMDVSSAVGKRITTIEGLSPTHTHAVQQAWIEHQVPQCGYCQSGQIMQAAAFLALNPNPTEKQVIEAMNGNICRCATYSRIVGAVMRAAEIARGGTKNV